MNAEEVYALLNKKIKKGGITDDQIKQIVEQHFEENPVQIITDNTLSVAGTPADALATGTAIDPLKGDIVEFYKPVSDLDNRKDVDLFVSDSYGNVLATFKNGEFATKEFSTIKSIGNNICDTLEECDLAISDVQLNV